MIYSGINFFKNISEKLKIDTAVSILDVVLVAVLLYLLFAFLKKYNATRLIKYIVAFLLISTVLSSKALGFSVSYQIFSYAAIISIIAVIIIFPQELRRSLYRIASPKEMSENFNADFNCPEEALRQAVADIVRAVLNMAKKNVGALIIIASQSVPTHILESGTELDSKISVQLLECLFNTKAPLHDGAVFIRGNRIISAGCFLPLSQNYSLDKELGTRHRAAVGVTEAYNLFAIIVSEESGVISTAHRGQIVRYYDSVMLTDILEQIYGLKATAAAKKKKRGKANG